jgi:hypothetical protein
MNNTLTNTNTYNNNNKLYLMLCELHYPGRHGKTNTSDPHIETHYLVYDRFDPITGISFTCLNNEDDYDTDEEMLNSDNDSDDDKLNKLVRITDEMTFLKRHYENQANFNPAYFGKHPTIRNYHNIISNPNYIKPEIGQYIILPTQEAVAILKTFWLRIIQRKWKKVFQERKEKRRLNCDERCLPSLRGMLNALL